MILSQCASQFLPGRVVDAVPGGIGADDEITAVLTGLGLPVQIPNELPREEILRAMRVDKKKNAASIRFALPVDVGNVELVEVTNLESVL